MENKLPRLSASKLKEYQKCPTMYQYRNAVDKTDSINVWGLIGTAAHKAIEMHYLSGIPIHTTFLQRVDAIDARVQGYNFYPDLTLSILKGLKGLDLSKYPVMAVDGKMQLERYFRLPYPNKENPICTLEGYIDHVSLTGFIDWKTGSDKPSRKGLKNDLQFAVYFWAYEQMYGRKPEYGIYYRIRDNKEIRITEVNDILDSAVKTILADPLAYELVICDNCPTYCAVRKLIERNNVKESQNCLSSDI